MTPGTHTGHSHRATWDVEHLRQERHDGGQPVWGLLWLLDEEGDDSQARQRRLSATHRDGEVRANSRWAGGQTATVVRASMVPRCQH